MIKSAKIPRRGRWCGGREREKTGEEKKRGDPYYSSTGGCKKVKVVQGKHKAPGNLRENRSRG